MKSVRAMIDISSIPYGRGVSRYTSNIVTSLIDQKQIDVDVFGYSARQYGVLRNWSQQFGSQVGKHILPIPPSVMHKLWQTVKFPNPAMFSDVDVFHAWDWQLAPIGMVNQVVTIHDLAYKLYPDAAHPKVVAMYDRLLATLENHPEIHIIAVSESTKKDIINLTSIPAEQITVIYEALPKEAQYTPSKEEVAAVKSSLPGDKPFVMTVGTTEPRKNINRMINAWRTVKDSYDLYIIGAQGWDTLPQESGIHYLGYVEPDRLASMYRLAHALLYVSLYEGFGLPILEAYYHECPVVTSAVSSMAEIAGSGAELVDPYNEAAIAEAITNIESRDSAARKKRLKAMAATLQQFSWDKAAEETRLVYEQVVNQ